MNALEFEDAVRELRRRQRRFFRCRKDDPDRDKALYLMREQEKVLRSVIEPVMATRTSRVALPEREHFFLLVADMMKKQRAWAKNGGGFWLMNPARDLENKVDAMLTKWNDLRELERLKKIKEEAKKQLSLF